MLAILAEDSPKVRDVQSVDDLNGIIDYLLTLLNIKTANDYEQQELNKQMVFILDFIRTKFGMLTIPEIKEAFRKYVARELDVKVYRILDSVVVGEVLSAYLEFRNESLRTYDDKKREAKNKLPEMTPEAKQQQLIDGVNRRYSEFKESKTVEEPLEHIFDFLVERGLIKTGNNPKLLAYYQDKLEQATKEVKFEQAQLTAKDPIERKKLKAELDAITSGQSAKPLIRAKKNILIEFFGKKMDAGIEKIFG